ncbi:hypothetical protein ACWDR0_16105 [Streptomyces sp. NPDC003691]
MPDADSLPCFRGRVVPWVTPWSGAPALPEPVFVNHGTGWGIAYADETVHDRTDEGVLLARGRGRRATDAGGHPLYEQLDPRRQRHASDRLLCQVCGQRPPPSRDGMLWLLAGPPGDHPEEALTTTPPVCPDPCAILAVRQCPALTRGYTAVRVRYPRAWGWRGVLYEFTRQGRGPGTLHRVGDRVHLPHGAPRLPWLLADLAVTRLMGCTLTGLDSVEGGP